MESPRFREAGGDELRCRSGWLSQLLALLLTAVSELIRSHTCLPKLVFTLLRCASVEAGSDGAMQDGLGSSGAATARQLALQRQAQELTALQRDRGEAPGKAIPSSLAGICANGSSEPAESAALDGDATWTGACGGLSESCLQRLRSRKQPIARRFCMLTPCLQTRLARGHARFEC